MIQQGKHYFSSKHEKIPKTIKGLDGIYSLKRLSEGWGSADYTDWRRL